MILFRDDTDKQLFLLEVGKSPDDSDTEDDHRLFIQRRRSSVALLKDFMRQQRAMRGWSRHRANLMSGIKSYHRSFAGMRFHRRLGRFLSLRTNMVPGVLREQLLYYMPIVRQAKIELLIEHFANQSFY